MWPRVPEPEIDAQCGRSRTLAPGEHMKIAPFLQGTAVVENVLGLVLLIVQRTGLPAWDRPARRGGAAPGALDRRCAARHRRGQRHGAGRPGGTSPARGARRHPALRHRRCSAVRVWSGRSASGRTSSVACGSVAYGPRRLGPPLSQSRRDGMMPTGTTDSARRIRRYNPLGVWPRRLRGGWGR